MAQRDLGDLTKKGLLVRKGVAKATRYHLPTLKQRENGRDR